MKGGGSSGHRLLSGPSSVFDSYNQETERPRVTPRTANHSAALSLICPMAFEGAGQVVDVRR